MTSTEGSKGCKTRLARLGLQCQQRTVTVVCCRSCEEREVIFQVSVVWECVGDCFGKLQIVSVQNTIWIRAEDGPKLVSPTHKKLRERVHIHGGKGLRQGIPKSVVGQAMCYVDPTARKAILDIIRH